MAKNFSSGNYSQIKMFLFKDSQIKTVLLDLNPNLIKVELFFLEYTAATVRKKRVIILSIESFKPKLTLQAAQQTQPALIKQTLLKIQQRVI